jgi:hypothetical protein
VITGTRAGGPGLRPAVLWHKGSFGSDSEAGSRFVERLLTVVATCRQQGRPLLDFLVAAGEAVLRGTAAPSLLPTRPGYVNAYDLRYLLHPSQLGLLTGVCAAGEA